MGLQDSFTALINYREIMRGLGRVRRFKFMTLPVWLQEMIVLGMRSGELTGDTAADLAGQHGYPISSNSIGRFWRALGRERRKLFIEASQAYFEKKSEVDGNERSKRRNKKP
jgi:hypothetical protein